MTKQFITKKVKDTTVHFYYVDPEGGMTSAETSIPFTKSEKNVKKHVLAQLEPKGVTDCIITDFSEHVATYVMTVEEFMKHAVLL